MVLDVDLLMVVASVEDNDKDMWSIDGSGGDDPRVRKDASGEDSEEGKMSPI